MSELEATQRERLDALVEFILAITAGDFQAQHPITEHRDEIDAVAVSLNMLAQEFAAERRRRQEAEEDLRDAIEGYDAAPAMFCSVDAETLTVVQCNRTLAEQLGRPRDTILGERLASLYASGHRALAGDSLQALLAGRRLPASDHLLACADGEVIKALLSGSVVRDSGGRARRLRLIYRDVTEERLLEAQLAQAQKMESIGQLAGGIAHDFNNMLTVIMVNGELLSGAVRPAERDDLQQILDAAQRASELTADAQPAQEKPQRGRVVRFVGDQRGRPRLGPARLSTDWRHAGHDLQRLDDVGRVRGGGRDDQRDALRVGQHVMLTADSSSIHRAGAAFSPPSGALTCEESSSDRDQSMRSARCSFESITRCNSAQTPAACHSASRRQQVMPQPQPISCGRSSQAIPVFSTNKMPVNARRSSSRGRPPPDDGSCFGSNGSTIAHSSLLTNGLAISTLLDRSRHKTKTIKLVQYAKPTNSSFVRTL